MDRRLRTLLLLAASEKSYLSRMVRRLKPRVIPDADKRPEAQGDGRYADLESGEEARYAFVAGYLSQVGGDGSPSVLDVGCGPGILQPYLSRHGYARYLGIDFAPNNIAVASRRADENTSFELARATEYEPLDTFDLIVFNEMLYFLDDPVGCIRSYMRHLEPGGLVVTSNTIDFATLGLVRALRTSLPILDETLVVNAAGFGWVIQAVGERKGSVLESR